LGSSKNANLACDALNLQSVIGSASTDDARSGRLGNGVLLGTALAREIRDAASRAGDSVLQAGERARRQHGLLTGNGLRVGNGSQDEGCDGELHVCGCIW